MLRAVGVAVVAAPRLTCWAASRWLAVPLLAVSLGAARSGQLGAAHLFIAALAAAVLTCAVSVVTRRQVNVAATVVTLCALGGVVAAARMWRPVPAQWLGM